MGCGKSVPTVSEKLREIPESKSEPAASQPTPSIAEPTPEVNKEVNFKPIHSAIRWNKPILEIEALLTSSSAVNCPDSSNGNCPIHIAAQNGHSDIIRLLISKKADLNVKNAKGNTGIHMAVGYDYFEVAKMLISAGADENMLNDLGIPANLGLEGDKAMGIAALVSAETAEDVEEAFTLCEAKLANLNKINFVSAGLKAKKGLGGFWTAEHQSIFKSITSRLS
jgi:ankyrin repeat protein